MKPVSVLVPPGSLVPGAAIDLDDAELHHLRVRRVSLDREVTAMDGAGSVATGSLRNRGGIAVFMVDEIATVAPQPVTVLAVGAGDRERVMQLAERATELGVSDVVPLDTDRSRTVETRWRDNLAERATRRAREACKQSGNPWATVVHELCTLEQLPARFAISRWLLADISGSATPQIAGQEPIGWIIGPEGGLKDDELAWCREVLLVEQVRFAGPILRFDTAAIAAAILTVDRRGKGA